MDLGRTVLDQELIDRHDRPMGKVDGILLELRPGAPARVSHLVAGGTTLAWRIHRGLARRLERALKGGGRPTTIPWERVIRIGVDVKVDVEAARTATQRWEHWVRDHVIGRIPGA
jgi:hypothetical protein